MNPYVTWIRERLLGLELSNEDALYLIHMILTRTRSSPIAGQNVTDERIKRQIKRNQITPNKRKTK